MTNPYIIPHRASSVGDVSVRVEKRTARRQRVTYRPAANPSDVGVTFGRWFFRALKRPGHQIRLPAALFPLPRVIGRAAGVMVGYGKSCRERPAFLTDAMTLRMKLISIIMTASAMPDQNRLVGASVSAIRTTACPINASARILPKFRHVMQKPAVMSGRTRPGAADPPQFADPSASGPAATAGLSALPLGGPPSWAERQSALTTHRPNSGSRSTRQEMAFRLQSGVAVPPPAWSWCGGSPGTTRRVRQDRPSGRPRAAGRSSIATQQTAPSRSPRLVSLSRIIDLQE
jgi:hypothetical protein